MANELDTAEHLQQQAIELCEQGNYREALPLLLRTQKKYAEAQPLLDHVLPIQEKQLGPEHPDVAETLSSLALVYSKQGEEEKAAAFYERALAIQEKVFGPRDNRTTHIVSSLAYVYQMQGEYAKALSLYERFLVVFEAHIALLDKKLAEISNRSLRESMDPIVEIYRKNRDLCRAQLQQTN